MTPERWQQIKEVFYAAQERQGDQRAAFLATACAGNEGLKREVESLLTSHDDAAAFIETPAFEVSSLPDSLGEKFIGRRLGNYRILREVGRGGMGVVFEASRDDAEFRQQVALKLIKRGLDTDDILRRFRNERQILAALNHPHIARLLDGGSTDDGLPYFVMEFIEGLPLLAYCDQNNLTTHARLQLFRKVCEAVAYAHRNLIVHRDLKPSNILVTTEGDPKLLDFGVAKFLAPELTDHPITDTATALRVMTPEYASPEQVRGLHVTTATDIYSLGVILYELLTGCRPYDLKSRQPAEVAEAICEHQPTRPSARIAEFGLRNANFKSADPKSAMRDPKSLRGDLDNILLMAIRKKPERRYASVQEFSEDIRRHLEGLPVIARKDTFAYRSAKFVRRNRVGVAVAVLLLLTLVGGIVATAWQARVARRERDAARLEKAKAERINTFLQDMIGFANPGWNSPNTQKGGDVTISQILDDVGPRIEKELADQPAVRAELQRTIGATYMYRARYDPAELYLQKALDTYLKIYGEQHSETAKTLVILAEVAYFKNDMARADQLQQRALTSYRKLKREGNVDDRMFAGALSDSALVALAKSDVKSAEALVREGLTVGANVTGGDRAVVAIMRSVLGYILADQGKLDEAEQLHRSAIAEFHQLPGRERAEVGSSLIGLGEVLTNKGQLAEAEASLLEAEAIHRRLLGDASPYVANNLLHQAYLRYLQGDYAHAEERTNSSLEMLTKLNPQGSPRQANGWRLLGRIMTRTGRAAEAEPLLRQALDMHTRSLPAGHHQIALTKGGLGECLAAEKRYAEAEPLLLESYNTLKAKLSEQDLRLKQATLLLAELYDAWGKPNEALQYR